MTQRCEGCGQPRSWHRDATQEERDQDFRERQAGRIMAGLFHAPFPSHAYLLVQGEPGTTRLRYVDEGRKVTVTITTEPN